MLLFLFVDYHVFFDIAPILYGIGIVLLLYLLVFGKADREREVVDPHRRISVSAVRVHEDLHRADAGEVLRLNDRAYLNFRSFMTAMLIIGMPGRPDHHAARLRHRGDVLPARRRGDVLRRHPLAHLGDDDRRRRPPRPRPGFSVLKPYQKDRIMIFLNPDRDPLGTGYQVTQAKIAIGSGGIHGKGFRQGTQAKLDFLPAHHTDFIFAVLGEEWGFIGVVIVLGLYLFLIVQALTFAKHARDRGGAFLAICLIAFFIFHILINVAMQIGVLPTTGIPLPLISYGGSSTMMFLMAIGLMLNVDMRRFVQLS